jgi:hypothetical protein
MKTDDATKREDEPTAKERKAARRRAFLDDDQPPSKKPDRVVSRGPAKRGEAADFRMPPPRGTVAMAKAFEELSKPGEKSSSSFDDDGLTDAAAAAKLKWMNDPEAGIVESFVRLDAATGRGGGDLAAAVRSAKTRLLRFERPWPEYVVMLVGPGDAERIQAQMMNVRNRGRGPWTDDTWVGCEIDVTEHRDAPVSSDDIMAIRSGTYRGIEVRRGAAELLRWASVQSCVLWSDESLDELNAMLTADGRRPVHRSRCVILTDYVDRARLFDNPLGYALHSGQPVNDDFWPANDGGDDWAALRPRHFAELMAETWSTIGAYLGRDDDELPEF